MFNIQTSNRTDAQSTHPYQCDIASGLKILSFVCAATYELYVGNEEAKCHNDDEKTGQFYNSTLPPTCTRFYIRFAEFYDPQCILDVSTNYNYLKGHNVAFTY